MKTAIADGVVGSAIFSPCERYRYELTRTWSDGRGLWCAFIGLNPSVATATDDDATMRRCTGFAKAWGFGGLIMTNLFAFRAQDPRDMLRADDPIGPENDRYLVALPERAETIVAAWGAYGGYLDRDRTVCRLLGDRLKHIGLTKDGYPRHPLYLKRDATVKPYTGREQR
jgi:hypothetical protein